MDEVFERALPVGCLAIALVGAWMCLLRTETVRGWALKSLKWEARLPKFLRWDWKRRYMGSRAYLWHLRFVGVVLLLMGVGLGIGLLGVRMPTW